jgi:hypothetical protein
MKAPERLCKWCDSVMPEQPSTPGRPKQFCSKSCRRSWHYGREKFLEYYTEEHLQKWQERWEWMVFYNGREWADEEAASFETRAAEGIARFDLALEPWKPNRRKAPRKVRRV